MASSADATAVGTELLSIALRHTRDAEIFWAREEAVTAGCDGSESLPPGSLEGEGMALRIITGGRVGMAVHLGPLASLHPASLLKEAVQAAARGPQAPPTFWKERETVPLALSWDDRVAALRVGDLQRLALQSSRRLGDMLGDAPTQVHLRRAVRHTAVLSRTFERRAEKTLFQYRVQVGVPGLPDATLTQAWASCRAPDDAMALLGGLPWKAACASQPVQAAPGVLPVVLSPAAAETLLHWFAGGFLGPRLVDGTSPLAGLMGKPCFDSRLQVADSPGIPWNASGGAFDGEGVVRRRRLLVDHGVVSGWLLDLSTAHRLGLAPTGSASRTIDGPPEPAPTCLEVRPGDQGFDELLEACEGGLYIEALDPLAGPDPAGAFTAGILEGFSICGGRPAGWAGGLALRGNVYQMLASQLLGIGSDVVLGGSACTGSLAFRDMEIVPAE